MFVCRDAGIPTESEEVKVLVTERGTDIGQKIAELRFEQALTQENLSELSGVNEITISNIERRKQRPSARTLRKLARAFGVEVRELTASGGTHLPGGAKSEEHLNAVLDHEAELREREVGENQGEGNAPGGGTT